MCEFAGYVGRQDAVPVLLGALRRLEYRGYDSAGLAAVRDGRLDIRRMPVVTIAPSGPTYDKMASNIEEVKARNGMVVAVATEGDAEIGARADAVIAIPPAMPWVQPLLVAPPLQRLAYHAGVLRGCDVDQPRNLAKSVTVE